MLHGGVPGAFGPQVGLFSPAFLPFLIVGPVTALNVVLVGWVLGGALTAFHLGRRLGLSSAGAVVCGMTFALAGYGLSAVNLHQPLMGLPWIPLAVSAFLGYLQTGRTRWIAATSLAAAMPLLAGSPEAALVLHLLLWLFAMSPPFGVPLARSRRVAGAALALALSVALSGVQLLPSIGVLRDSERGSGFSFSSFAWNSVDPRRLPELMLPGVLGPTDTLNDADYWGRRIVDGGYPFVLSLYLGASVLPLILVGAFSSRSAFPRGLRLSLFSLIVAALLFSLGRHLPFVEYAVRLGPAIRLLRYPVKACTLVISCAALLGAAGTQVRSSVEGRRQGLAAAAVGGFGFALMLGLALALLLARGGARATQAWFGLALSSTQRLALAGSFLHAAFFSVLACALLAYSFLRHTRAWVAWALALVAAADLTIAGTRLNPTAPRSLFSRPQLANTVAAVVGEGRLFRDRDPIPFTLRAPSNEIVHLAHARISLLSDYVAAGYGIPVTFNADYDSLAPARIVALGDRLRRASWGERLAAFRAAGVTAVLTWERISAPGYLPQGEWKWQPSALLRLYAISGGSPARFASRAVMARDAAEARDLLLSGVDRPVSSVILEGVPPARGGCNGGKVVVESSTPDVLHAEVTAPCPGWAVFAEVFAAGWSATVDGVAAPVIPADAAFRAVQVPRGLHRIEMRYRPPGLDCGLALSALAAVPLLGLCVRSRQLNPPAGGGHVGSVLSSAEYDSARGASPLVGGPDS